MAKLIAQNHPLRGKEAADAMRQHLSTMGNTAAEEGLTPADVMRMRHED